MSLDGAITSMLAVTPGKPASLAKRDPAARPEGLGGSLPKTERRQLLDEELGGFTAELAAAQELLYASGTWAVLVILQGLDAAGKDGTIKHVMSGVNPQGCEVVSFKQPSAEELDHDFLWRAAKSLPASGRIGIFNRSYYEDVIVVRVHPDLLAAQHLPGHPEPAPALWKQRYEDINAFERHLERSGVRIVKCFLHLSKREQKKRLLERLDNPAKYWKFSEADLSERGYWDDYQAAYEEALTATSTPWAPWYVVPADHKHVMRALVAGILVETIGSLGLAVPEVTPAKLDLIHDARARLLGD
ncbi:MAG: polyphosphate kinase 2 family protein [Acidimicrobiales bacterium]